jgi:hypothetical protein
MFNDSAFSPVGSGQTNAEATPVRPQGSFREIYSNSKKETKLSEERQGFKIILSSPPVKYRKHARNQGKKQELVGNLSPR